MEVCNTYQFDFTGFNIQFGHDIKIVAPFSNPSVALRLVLLCGTVDPPLCAELF